MNLDQLSRFSAELRTEDDLEEGHETEAVDLDEDEEFLDALFEHVRLQKDEKDDHENGFQDGGVDLPHHGDGVLPVTVPDLGVLQRVDLAHVLVVLVHVDEEQDVADQLSGLQRNPKVDDQDFGQGDSFLWLR